MKYRLNEIGIERVKEVNGYDEYPLDGRTFEGRTEPENEKEAKKIMITDMIGIRGMFVINAKGEEMFMPSDMFEEVTE